MLYNPASLPTRSDALQILEWANAQSPGPWQQHSLTVGRTAGTIARACGMDSDIAYVLGLLHDIGRYEGVSELHHILAGYSLMEGKSYIYNARICLTHSFPIKDIKAYSGKSFDCTEQELTFIKTTLTSIEYDDYDRLIQLCDALCLPAGVCLLEVRLMDVTRRHGFNTFTIDKWNAMFALKDYFDQLCSRNIYELFYDEICNTCIR